MLLSVIVPAFNEEKRLLENIKKYNNYLSRQNYQYEIIIVNDGSTDKTAEIARRLESEIQELRLIDNQINRGKGAAVCQGLLAARGEYRLFLDADNATSINHLDLVWPQFKAGNDIVIGSRNPKDANKAYQAKKQKFIKRMLGVGGNRIFQFFILQGIWDTQCGFKAFSKKATKKIIPKITIKRWIFDVEILLIAKRLNYKIGKIPVRWINRPHSRVGIQGYFIAFFELLKLKINLWQKKY